MNSLMDVDLIETEFWILFVIFNTILDCDGRIANADS